MAKIRIQKLKSGNYIVLEGRNKVQEGPLGSLEIWAQRNGHGSWRMLNSELIAEQRAAGAFDKYKED